MEAAMATVILDHTRVTHKKLPLGSLLALTFTLLALPFTWITRARQRRELMSQSEHILHDLGLQRHEITCEGLKPFWRQ
jgi:uncharacterized protein YjiS (DUF1127 family)